MINFPAHWTHYDYLALTLIYAAQADQDFNAAEYNHLQRLCGITHYTNAQAFMQSLSESEIIEAITKGRAQFYPGGGGAQALDYQIRSLFQADDHFSQIEQETLQILTRLW